MVNHLQKLVPEFSHFEELALQYDSEVVGHQTVLILNNGFPYSGGLHEDRNTSRRICAAEAIERSVVSRLRANSMVDDPFGLRKVSSTCGFAAGFEREPTFFRSVCEAVERWVWSKWIDEGLAPKDFKFSPERKLQKCLAAHFDEVKCFRSEVQIQRQGLPVFVPSKLQFVGVIGIKGNGIFPGARVSTDGDDLLTHCLVEAWRHLKIFENELQAKKPATLIDARIKEFGTNGKSKLTQIESLRSKPLPEVRLEFAKMVSEKNGYFVSRALAADYRQWNEGPNDRFVY